MHVCLPLYRQSEEALASSTQVERDRKEGRVQGSGVTSRISPETGGRMEACLLPALFPTGRHTSYFTVLSEGRLQDKDSQQLAEKPNSIAASVLQLATIEQDQEKRGNIASKETSGKETSPWLQLTR